MNQLFTVNVPSGSKTLIPKTVAEFLTDLGNPVLKVYVYVGQETDAGWSEALLAAGLLPNLQPYLATDIAVMRPWVPAGNPSGIVFGRKTIPARLLDAVEAADDTIVQTANVNAP